MELDEEGFLLFLKKKRKTPRTNASCIEGAKALEDFLQSKGKSAEKASVADFEEFVSAALAGRDIAKYMWTLQYYLQYVGNSGLLRYSQKLREKHIAKKRKPFKLKDFAGVDQESIGKLSAAGIDTVEDMLHAAKTESQRIQLAERIEVDLEEILELAKLSNLTRLGAVKAVRARLYHDSGFDSIGKIANTTAEGLIRVTKEFIDSTGFQGIPPTPKEAENTVRAARRITEALEL